MAKKTQLKKGRGQYKRKDKQPAIEQKPEPKVRRPTAGRPSKGSSSNLPPKTSEIVTSGSNAHQHITLEELAADLIDHPITFAEEQLIQIKSVLINSIQDIKRKIIDINETIMPCLGKIEDILVNTNMEIPAPTTTNITPSDPSNDRSFVNNNTDNRRSSPSQKVIEVQSLQEKSEKEVQIAEEEEEEELPEQETPEVEVVKKIKKRGRPPKLRPVSSTPPTPTITITDLYPKEEKKKRGRKPKNALLNTTSEELIGRLKSRGLTEQKNSQDQPVEVPPPQLQENTEVITSDQKKQETQTISIQVSCVAVTDSVGQEAEAKAEKPSAVETKRTGTEKPIDRIGKGRLTKGDYNGFSFN